MSDSPRTDKWCELAMHTDVSAVLDLAKEYERELNEAKAELKTVLGSPSLKVSAELAKARESENAQLRAELERLKTDYKNLHATLINREKSLEQSGCDWVKAKEDIDKWRAMARELAAELNWEATNPALVMRFNELEKSI